MVLVNTETCEGVCRAVCVGNYCCSLHLPSGHKEVVGVSAGVLCALAKLARALGEVPVSAGLTVQRWERCQSPLTLCTTASPGTND